MNALFVLSRLADGDADAHRRLGPRLAPLVGARDAPMHGSRAADRSRCRLEHGEEAVAERLHLAATRALEHLAQEIDVAEAPGLPVLRPESRHGLRGADQIGEENRD